jgi:cytochrome c oxidase subunit 2
VTAAVILAGCGASQQFPAVPSGLDRTTVPVREMTMTARRYEFIPDTVRVSAGTLLKLRVTSTGGTHGFALGAFGIDERLEEGVTKEIEVYASRKGVYTFRCSHLCGIGHFGMDGVLIVE